MKDEMKITNREWENGKVKGRGKKLAERKKGRTRSGKKNRVIGKEDTKRQGGKRSSERAG